MLSADSFVSSLARRVLVRPIQFLLLACALIGLAVLADRWTLAHVSFPEVYNRDWGRMLRTMGFLPFWLLAGAALILCDRPRPDWPRRGLLLMAAPVLGGGVAELLKILIRRERPKESNLFIFRHWAYHPFATGGLTMPSSHVFVAFAAAATLARFWPRARLIWFGLAVGCGLSRLFVRAHYLSDVVVAAIGGYAVASLLWSATSSWLLKQPDEARQELDEAPGVSPRPGGVP